MKDSAEHNRGSRRSETLLPIAAITDHRLRADGWPVNPLGSPPVVDAQGEPNESDAIAQLVGSLQSTIQAQAGETAPIWRALATHLLSNQEINADLASQLIAVATRYFVVDNHRPVLKEEVEAAVDTILLLPPLRLKLTFFEGLQARSIWNPIFGIRLIKRLIQEKPSRRHEIIRDFFDLIYSRSNQSSVVRAERFEKSLQIDLGLTAEQMRLLPSPIVNVDSALIVTQEIEKHIRRVERA